MELADAIATARQLAREHPQARLPCPACAVTVKAENLDDHLERVHPGSASLAPPWRGRGFLGVFPCSIAFEGDALALRHTLTLFRRLVRLPCAIEVGTLVGSRPDVITAGHATEWNPPSETVRVGRYVRFVGDRSITIGCRQHMKLDAHWRPEPLRDGKRRRMTDVVLPRVAIVAIEYELARRGILVPASPVT